MIKNKNKNKIKNKNKNKNRKYARGKSEIPPTYHRY